MINDSFAKQLNDALNKQENDSSNKELNDLYDYIHAILGQHIYANPSGDTVIDLLYTTEIKNEHGLPVKALVTDALNSVRAQRDINHLELSDYIYNIEQIMHHPDRLRITHGKDIANKELGKVFTINYVQNAENDHYNQPLCAYIKSINQYEPNSFTINTGEQDFNNVNGKTIIINKVNDSNNAINDQYGNNIANTYAQINHTHSINDVNQLKHYIEENIIQIVNKLLAEGKIKIENCNTIKYNQYPKYDFNDNETISIELPKNTQYNRPMPEVLKLKNDNDHQSSFNYSFNSKHYIYDKKYINDNGKLITSKNILFGPPRQLNNGYVSYSGIITTNNIKQIANMIIK